jgi:hypothetical protein
MEVPVTIYTHNNTLIFDLLEENSVSKGLRKQLTNDLAVRFDSAKIHGALDVPEVIQITLVVAEHLAEAVAAGLITYYLLKKLDRDEAKVTKLEIGSVTVDVDKDKIRKIVLKKIRRTS